MLRDTGHEVSIDAPQGMSTVTAFDPDGTLLERYSMRYLISVDFPHGQRNRQ